MLDSHSACLYTRPQLFSHLLPSRPVQSTACHLSSDRLLVLCGACVSYVARFGTITLTSDPFLTPPYTLGLGSSRQRHIVPLFPTLGLELQIGPPVPRYTFNRIGTFWVLHRRPGGLDLWLLMRFPCTQSTLYFNSGLPPLV